MLHAPMVSSTNATGARRGLARPVAGRRDKLSSEGLRRLLRVVALLGLADLGQHALGEGLGRPRQGFGGVGDRVRPAALLSGVGEDVAKGGPTS
jgi:hypothetical protein